MLWLCALYLTAQPAHPEKTDTTEVELGVLRIRNFELASFERNDATEDWRKTIPTARLEYWKNNSEGWNYGVALQPIYFTISNTLKDRIDYKGTTLNAGDPAKLTYQFHNARFTGNYPVLQSGESYLRIGGSAILRYANVHLATPSAEFTSVNTLLIPIPNIEAKLSMGADYSLLLRSDFFPAKAGYGLYDVLLALRQENKHQPWDVGLRLFWGGYDPKELGNFRNKIFLGGLVMRKSF